LSSPVARWLARLQPGSKENVHGRKQVQEKAHEESNPVGELQPTPPSAAPALAGRWAPPPIPPWVHHLAPRLGAGLAWRT